MARLAHTKRTTESPMLAHVHETTETVTTISETPPHPPREDTSEYAAAHHFLVYEKKAPCEVCGVTIDTLDNPTVNLWQATAIESHHWPIERSYVDACDPVRVHADFPSVYNRATLVQFVDSPANLKILCSTHHRSVEHGIHHLLPAQFAVQKYLYAGYLIAAVAKDAAAVAAQDEQVMVAQGIEPAAAADLSAPAASSSSPVAGDAPLSPERAPAPRRERAAMRSGGRRRPTAVNARQVAASG